MTQGSLIVQLTRRDYLALFSGNDDVLIAVTTLLGRAIDAAAGVHNIANQIPVGRVSRRHNRQIQGQLEQLFHSLQQTISVVV